MSVTPKRNLPPAAEPWGRSVDARVQALESAGARQKQDNDNTLSGLNSSLVRLAEQVGEIRTVTETLVEQQATLETQQAQLQAQQSTLSTQQAQLTAQVAQINSVINGMVTARTETAAQYVTYSGTVGNYAPVSFTTPVGYTRAYVMSVVSASFDGPSVNGAISAQVGVEWSSSQAVQSGTEVVTASASYADFFTLAPGQVFTCSARVVDGSGAVSGWVQTSAIAIFLR